MRTKEKERIEKAIRHNERKEIRQKNVKEYFLDFSKHHRTWIHRLADKYKKHGEFPMFPTVILPSYYESPQDKEVAVFAAILIKENGDFDRIQAFREMMGKSPWEWFEKREFVKLSLGKIMDNRTGGVQNWKIARLMDRLWKECFGAERKGIGDAILNIAKTQYCSYFDAVTWIAEDCGIGNYFYRLRLLIMVMGTDDGFGLGLWNIQNNIDCPIAPGLREFVENWFPDWKRAGNLDDAIRLFGFERDCDFFYAFLGYKELQKRNPKGCGLYATRVRTWYELGSKMKKNKWRYVMPEIEF